MSTIVHFSADLSAWLTQNLERGQAPAALVQIMIGERMDPRVARAIVDAFVSARLNRQPLPVDSVTLEEEAPAFVYQPPRLPSQPRLETHDRVVRVVARVAQPALVVLADVLSAAECAELIELARPRLAPSTVMSPDSGKDVVAAHRTSQGMFFRLRENAFIARLDQRVSELMNLPIENGEGFQVLHYPVGAETTPHFDFLRPSIEASRASIGRSGQRVSTLIAYLNDVDSGGETVFPELPLAVLPQRGNAVYFEYTNSLGQVDERSLHGGNPVLSGEKWVVTKWMRERRFVSANDAGSEGMLG